MSVDDAVFALALQRYILIRSRWGDQVTELAAAQVSELAREIGLVPSSRLAALGFRVDGTCVHPLERKALVSAIRLVKEHGRAAVVETLYSQCEPLTVGQLERRGVQSR